MCGGRGGKGQHSILTNLVGVEVGGCVVWGVDNSNKLAD